MKKVLSFLTLQFLGLSDLYATGKLSPVAASKVASDYDTLYTAILIVSAIASVMVVGGFVYFALKYKRKTSEDKTAYITHNHFLEFLWSFIPLVLFTIIFAWGWWIYHDMRTFPKDSFEIHVVAQKWSWSFQYKSGKKTTAEVYVPVNTPIKLIMSSKDVLHSFFILL